MPLDSDRVSYKLQQWPRLILRLPVALKKIKEDVEKVKKIICEKDGNIDNETQNLKRNQKAILELKKHSN